MGIQPRFLVSVAVVGAFALGALAGHPNVSSAAGPAAPAPPAGGPYQPQAHTLATPVVPPWQSDPIVTRNCGAEFEQAIQKLDKTFGTPQWLWTPSASGEPLAPTTCTMAHGNNSVGCFGTIYTLLLNAQTEKTSYLEQRNAAAIARLQCETDKANRKLDYVLAK